MWRYGLQLVHATLVARGIQSFKAPMTIKGLNK